MDVVAAEPAAVNGRKLESGGFSSADVTSGDH